MMVFRVGEKDYFGASALEIIRALESDEMDYPHQGQTVRKFLKWSLHRLGDQIPLRDMHVSRRMKIEDLALSYLCLRDEFGAGELMIKQNAKS
jgi:hypothetical protein